VCICMRMHMCVDIYIRAFFCNSVACTLQVGHLCMGRCARYTGVFLHQRTHLRTHSLQVVHICTYVFVYMHAYADGCVSASMILLDAYMCIFIYVRICMHMHMDAYVRL